jgi:alpha-ribazole phosphatase
LPAAGELDKVVTAVHKKIVIPEDATFLSSPLLRCTLLASAFANGRTIATDVRIAELDFGQWEMMQWKAIPQEEMEIWSSDFVNNKAGGGESFTVVLARVRSFWNELILSDETTKIVTTHSGVFRALLVIILEASPYKVFNAEVEYGDIIRVEV